MTNDELETFKNLTLSNSSFCNAINNDTIPTFDFYTTLELIILYLKVNSNILKKMGLTDLIELTMDGKFTVKDTTIIHKDFIYSVDYLKDLVYKIKEEYDQIEKTKVIPFPTSIVVEEQPSPKNEFIQLKIPELSSKQRGLIFENVAAVNQDTLPYIRETRDTFTERIYYVLDCIFKNKPIEFEFDGDYKLIASILNLYPLTEYLNEEDVPYLDFNLPQNTIGLRTAKYEGKEVDKIEQRIHKYSKEQERLESILHALKNVSTKERIQTITSQIEEYRRREFKALFDKYTATHEELIFNKTIINYLKLALYRGYIDVNYHYLNPLVRIFYIEDNKVKFICTMHLDTFYNIVDSKNYTVEKPHKLEYKSE